MDRIHRQLVILFWVCGLGFAVLLPYSCRFQSHDLGDLFEQLYSDNPEAWVEARRILILKGDPILPALVQEMNSPRFIASETESDEIQNLKRVNRWRFESIIGQITGEDFGLQDACHYGDMDYSFDRINEWWLRKKRYEDVVEHTKP